MIYGCDLIRPLLVLHEESEDPNQGSNLQIQKQGQVLVVLGVETKQKFIKRCITNSG